MTNKFINENFDKEIAEMKKVNSLLKEKGPTNNDKRLVVERNKFKTEVGKILYDLLIQISDDNLFLYDIFSSVKGDEKKLQLIEYLKENQRNKNEIEHVASLIDIGIYILIMKVIIMNTMEYQLMTIYGVHTNSYMKMN